MFCAPTNTRSLSATAFIPTETACSLNNPHPEYPYERARKTQAHQSNCRHVEKLGAGLLPGYLKKSRGGVRAEMDYAAAVVRCFGRRVFLLAKSRSWRGLRGRRAISRGRN